MKKILGTIVGLGAIVGTVILCSSCDNDTSSFSTSSVQQESTSIVYSGFNTYKSLWQESSTSVISYVISTSGKKTVPAVLKVDTTKLYDGTAFELNTSSYFTEDGQFWFEKWHIVKDTWVLDSTNDEVHSLTYIKSDIVDKSIVLELEWAGTTAQIIACSPAQTLVFPEETSASSVVESGV